MPEKLSALSQRPEGCLFGVGGLGSLCLCRAPGVGMEVLASTAA